MCGRLESVLPSNVASMSKETRFFLQVICFDTAFQERWHWPGMKPFHAFKATSLSSDTWPKLSQEQYLTLTLHRLGVHLVGQRFCWKRVKFDYSFRGCLGHFVREFPAGSSSHRHACHHCLNIKKKYIFPFLNLSLFLSLSFPDHLMLDGQSSCLSFHLPKQSLASQAMTGAVAVVMDDCVSSGRVGRS